MLLLGSCYHAPDALAVFLKTQLRITPRQIAFVSVGCTLPKKPAAKCLIFLSVAALKNHLTLVNSHPYENVVGAVCDSVLALNNITGVTPLDYGMSENFHLDGFVLSALQTDVLASHGATVSIKDAEFEQVVIEKVQSFKGFLTTFMTFIYTMPNATHQTPLKELACRWLAGVQDVNTLEREFHLLIDDIKLSEQKQTRFLALLSSELALLYKEVLRRVANVEMDSKEFYAIVNEAEVSAYEIRYILAVAKKAKVN
jgi:hypothetical protein